MTELPGVEEFRPEMMSRRGELLAWLLALVVAAGWFTLVRSGQRIPGAVGFLEVFLLFSAASISLGNWIDRRTILRLEPGGIQFTNGLRNVRLAWGQIRKVHVFPSGWGKKVRVIGRESHFEFRTLGEVKAGGEVKGRLGFAEGDRILQQILKASGLKEEAVAGRSPSGTRYYEARD